MNQPKLYVPIGVSGSGKTTLRNKLQETNTTMQVFSLDVLRHLWYDKEDYAKAWEMSVQDKSFFSRSQKDFAEKINTGLDVFVDNTNLTPKSRRFCVQEAKKRGYKTIAILFPSITLELLISRQTTRGDKNVPETAVRQQYNSLTSPLDGEFDEVWNV